ncbi:DMT family transporter [Roseomonas sp. CCTCC AB2023176]|uniref:DMT family transporter n=1 Tax=Roseomonas sp. CCTCC AB2023176 TaxID=3342640 RepID=UPI0035D98367
MSTSNRSENAAGIGLMLLAALMFALNDTLGKWLVATYSVGQVLVLRSLTALIVLAPLVHRDGVAHLIRPARPGLQGLRVLLGSVEVASFYWAVSLMPLADTLAFWMAVPIFVAVASALFLREPIRAARLAAVGLGFGGVALALGARLDAGWQPAAVAGVGVVMYTGFLLCTRSLRGTPASVLAVYQMLGAMFLGLALLPFGWVTPSLFDAALLMLLGVVGAGAHLLVTRSLALAPAAVVVPWQYSMIVWGVLFGWAFFGDVPTSLMLLGVGVIVAAGLWLGRLDMARSRGA